MKKSLFALLLLSLPTTMTAQESETTYNFLRIPISAHAAALGGDNITIVEDDATLMFHNPALLSTVSDKTLNFNYMNYMQGANSASASFNKILKERTSIAFSGQYINFGKMKEMDANNVQRGDFSAGDIAISGYFSYLLTDKLAGGITAKFITSNIGQYNSIAMGVDLGINYYDADREWSLSAVAKNLGGQLKAYNDDYENMPFDLQVGATKRFANMPLRLSLTLVDLHRWNYKFIHHAVVGCDIILSPTIWVGAGYNARRAYEMKVSDGENSSSRGAGLSLGAGINLERFKLNLAYGKYHVSSSSLIVNLAYSL